MSSPRHVQTTNKTRPKRSIPTVTNRSSSGCGSSIVSARGSSKTPTVSAKSTRCLRKLALALRGFHWKGTQQLYVQTYTEARPTIAWRASTTSSCRKLPSSTASSHAARKRSRLCGIHLALRLSCLTNQLHPRTPTGSARRPLVPQERRATIAGGRAVPFERRWEGALRLTSVVRAVVSRCCPGSEWRARHRSDPDSL